MKLVHESEVLERYPSNYTAALAIRGPVDHDVFARAAARALEEIQPAHIESAVAEGVARWRKIYSQMNARPKYQSSLESLRDSFVENRFPSISPVVDFYNAYSVLRALPMGMYDLEKISGDLRLRIAEKGLPFTPLGAPKDVNPTKANEVIYQDDERVVCRYWNMKDSDATKIDDDTRSEAFLFVFDIVTEEGPENARAIARSIESDFASALSLECNVGLTGVEIGREIEV